MGVARAVDYIVSGAGSEESPLRKQDRTHEDPLLDKAPPAGALRFFYGDDGGFAHVEVTGGGGRGAPLLSCAAGQKLQLNDQMERGCTSTPHIQRYRRRTQAHQLPAPLSWNHCIICLHCDVRPPCSGSACVYQSH